MDDETRIRMMDIARKSSKGKKDHKSKKKDTGVGAVLMLQSTLSKIPEPPKKKMPTIQPGFQLSIRDLKGKPEETFTITKKVGSMNYLANRSGTPHTYFVKIESYESHNAPKQLKREILLLEELRKSAHAENFKNYFPHVSSKGRVKDAPSTEGFNFVIERYAPTPVNNLLQRFTYGDVARFANQSFQFIRYLHEELGWIHRNIGPNAFRFGTKKHPPARLTMVSFGYAVRFKPAMLGKPTKSPRKMVRRADPTFMPRSYYHVRDFLPKDDLEMWLFLIVYCMVPEAIKWDAKSNDVTALTMKEQFFCMDVTEGEYAVLPKSIQIIIKYLYKLDQKSVIDYKMIQTLLDNMGALEGVNHFNVDYDFLNNEFRTEPYQPWRPQPLEKLDSMPKKLKKPSKIPASSKNSSAAESDPFNEPVIFKAQGQGSSKKMQSKKGLKPKPPAAAPPKAVPNEFAEMPEDNDPFDMAAVIGEGDPSARPSPNEDEEEKIEPPPPPTPPTPRQPASPSKKPTLLMPLTPDKKKGPRRKPPCVKAPKGGRKVPPTPAASPAPDTPPSPAPAGNEATEGEEVASPNKQGEAVEPTGKTETVGESPGNEESQEQQFYDLTATNSSAVSASVATSKATPTVFSANKVPSTKDDEDPKEEL
uniref:Protein kinase domain-containing protein n=1 Tax=Panagrellus redivivus TaxID=6233 RepID=A0A7E4V203_PANRE